MRRVTGGTARSGRLGRESRPLLDPYARYRSGVVRSVETEAMSGPGRGPDPRAKAHARRRKGSRTAGEKSGCCPERRRRASRRRTRRAATSVHHHPGHTASVSVYSEPPRERSTNRFASTGRRDPAPIASWRRLRALLALTDRQRLDGILPADGLGGGGMQRSKYDRRHACQESRSPLYAACVRAWSPCPGSQQGRSRSPAGRTRMKDSQTASRGPVPRPAHTPTVITLSKRFASDTRE